MTSTPHTPRLLRSRRHKLEIAVDDVVALLRRLNFLVMEPQQTGVPVPKAGWYLHELNPYDLRLPQLEEGDVVTQGYIWGPYLQVRIRGLTR